MSFETGTCSERERNAEIPILDVRGTHREIGREIGMEMKKSILELVDKSNDFLDPEALAAYETEEGRKIYEDSLTLCRKKYPGYVEELEGMSESSEVPFQKIFLLHIDTLIIPPKPKSSAEQSELGTKGCTSVISFLNDSVYLGHTEDGPVAMLNKVYVLNAEILDREGGKVIENFSTLCYTAYLPGGTMGYNQHGLLHSVNSMGTGITVPGKTPILFMMRALLGARTLEDVHEIMIDAGTGSSDGFSLNLVFAPEGKVQIVQNIELGANFDKNVLKSEVNIFNVPAGDSFAHCNKILRLPLREVNEERALSSVHRHAAIDRYRRPYSLEYIKNILSDETDKEFPIYRTDFSQPFITLLTGIFDVKNRTWSLYTSPADKSEPAKVLMIDF